MQPWQLQPYSVWNFDFPQFQGSKELGGVTFDPSTDRLYVVELGADTEAPYSYLPVVQVYQLTLSSAPSSDAQPSAALQVAPASTVTNTGTPQATALGTLNPSAVVVGTPSDVTDFTTTSSTADKTLSTSEGSIKSKKPHLTQPSVFSRTNTLLELANSPGRVRDQIRPGTGKGLKSSGMYRSDLEL